MNRLRGLLHEKDDFLLKPKTARYVGAIDTAMRTADGGSAHAFLTTAALPVGEELAGRWIVVTHGDGGPLA